MGSGAASRPVTASISDPEQRGHFPRLASGRVAVTSPPSGVYNCIAWAAGDEQSWWWPDILETSYWPPGIPRLETLEAFERAYATLGYQPCADGSFETGWSRVAVYAGTDGTPTHAARQLPDGTWTSKLGGLEDIMHERLDQLDGVLFGAAARFFKRRA